MVTDHMFPSVPGQHHDVTQEGGIPFLYTKEFALI